MSAFGLRADLELQAILHATASQVLVRKANDRLFQEGDESDGVYLVKRGTLRLSLDSATGKTVLNRTVGVGYVVGLPATINGHNYSLNCDVVEDAELAFVPRSAVTCLIHSDAETAMKLLDLLSSEIELSGRHSLILSSERERDHPKMCEKGIELAIRINQAEQELTAASNNFRNTGLARYKQTVMSFEAEFYKVTIELEQHRGTCSRCHVLL